MRLGDRARLVRAAWLAATAGLGLATIVGSNSSSSESEPTFEPPPPSNLEVVTVEYPRVVFANGVATIAYNESTRRGAAQQFRARAFRFDPAANSTDASVENLMPSHNNAPVLAGDASGASIAIFGSGGTPFLCRFGASAGWLCETPSLSMPAVALDGAGRALALKSSGNTLLGAHYVPGSGWGADQSIANSTNGAARPAVVYWSGGVGYAVWLAQQTDDVFASRFSRTADAWENPVLLGRGHVDFDPLLVLPHDAPSAGALAVWTKLSQPLEFSRFVPGSGWTPAAPVPGAAPATQGFGLALAMSANGDALLVEHAPSPDPQARIVNALRFANGAWEPPQAIGSAAAAPFVHVAMDGAGNGVAAWRRQGSDALFVARYVAGSGWRTAEELVAEALPLEGEVGPNYDIAMDASGRIVIAAARRATDGGSRVQLTVLGLFEVALTPGTLDVPSNGGSGAVAVHVQRTSFGAPLALEVLDCPAKVICTLGRTQLPSDETDTALTFITSSGDPAVAGAYDVRVQVVGGAQTSRAAVRLTLTTSAPPPPPNPVLTVVVDGNGRVVSTPAGIDCTGPLSCHVAFAPGTVVTLAAAPSPGHVFGGFGGAADCSDGAVTVAADLQCTATFNPNPTAAAWRAEGAAGVNRSPATQAAFVEHAAIEIDADGRPVAAFVENGAVVVRRSNGAAWTDLGVSPSAGEAVFAALTIDGGGAPVVAWQELAAAMNGTHDVHVARWDGTAWAPLGGVLDVSPAADATWPWIRARSGDLVIAWSESLGGGGSRIVVRRWTGTAWVNAGGTEGPPSTPALDSFAPRLAVSAADDLAVVWVEQFGSVRVAELVAGAWTPTATAPFAGAPAFGAPIASLDIAYTNAQGLLVVAQPTLAGPLQVRRWQAGAWSDLGTPRGSAVSTVFGVAFSHHRAGAIPLLAIARRTTSTHEFVVERFAGSDWAPVGAPIDPVDRHGRPGFEFRVSVADGALPRVATTVIGTLPSNPVESDRSVVVYRFE